MSGHTSSDSGKARPVIRAIECKACGRCVDACPEGLLRLSDDFNDRGYRYVQYCGSGCTGCANCFYVCPEPNTLEIRRPDRDDES